MSRNPVDLRFDAVGQSATCVRKFLAYSSRPQAIGWQKAGVCKMAVAGIGATITLKGGASTYLFK